MRSCVWKWGWARLAKLRPSARSNCNLLSGTDSILYIDRQFRINFTIPFPPINLDKSKISNIAPLLVKFKAKNIFSLIEFVCGESKRSSFLTAFQFKQFCAPLLYGSCSILLETLEYVVSERLAHESVIVIGPTGIAEINIW